MRQALPPERIYKRRVQFKRLVSDPDRVVVPAGTKQKHRTDIQAEQQIQDPGEALAPTLPEPRRTSPCATGTRHTTIESADDSDSVAELADTP